MNIEDIEDIDGVEVILNDVNTQLKNIFSHDEFMLILMSTEGIGGELRFHLYRNKMLTDFSMSYDTFMLNFSTGGVGDIIKELTAAIPNSYDKFK